MYKTWEISGSRWVTISGKYLEKEIPKAKTRKAKLEAPKRTVLGGM
jgi:hypothetical protein